jgi:hypothetical protein
VLPEAKDTKFSDFINSQFQHLETQIGIASSIDFTQEQKLVKERNLPQFLGNIINHTPKEVIAVTVAPEGVLYLCSWHQDYEEQYLIPSWVQSEYITQIVGQRLVV